MENNNNDDDPLLSRIQVHIQPIATDESSHQNMAKEFAYSYDSDLIIERQSRSVGRTGYVNPE